MSLNDLGVQSQFPQLARQVRGRRLVYLDSAATTLKPVRVIEAVDRSLRLGAANVHRGAHFIGDEATAGFEKVREQVAKFIGAETADEVVFTKGTTEGINLLASSLGEWQIESGDEIILSQMEHHSNIVPWQIMAKARGATVRFVKVTDDLRLDFEHFKLLLNKRTRIVSLVHLSNALGTMIPLKEFFSLAKQVGAICVADVAQSVAMCSVSRKSLGCDFMVFSGHKLFGPTGVGVVTGSLEMLNEMPPYQGGGSMIHEVTEKGSSYLASPHRFEAGTPPIAEVMGLGMSVEFVESVGLENIEMHDRELVLMARQKLSDIPGVRVFAPAGAEFGPALSFSIEGRHHSDVAAILDQQGVAVRAGHHCCQPLMARLGIPGTVRASFSVYSTQEDVAALVAAVEKAKEMLT